MRAHTATPQQVVPRSYRMIAEIAMLWVVHVDQVSYMPGCLDSGVYILVQVLCMSFTFLNYILYVP